MSKPSTLMPTSKKVYFEGGLAIRQQIPAHAMQRVAFYASDTYALPAKPRRLPSCPPAPQAITE